jgi:hypothetical protein
LEPKGPIAILHNGYSSCRECTKDDAEMRFPGASTTDLDKWPDWVKEKADKTAW